MHLTSHSTFYNASNRDYVRPVGAYTHTLYSASLALFLSTVYVHTRYANASLALFLSTVYVHTRYTNASLALFLSTVAAFSDLTCFNASDRSYARPIGAFMALVQVGMDTLTIFCRMVITNALLQVRPLTSLLCFFLMLSKHSTNGCCFAAALSLFSPPPPPSVP